jgi:hypothetical protein
MNSKVFRSLNFHKKSVKHLILRASCGAATILELNVVDRLVIRRSVTLM